MAKVSVIGSGIVGRAWAVLFARAKFQVYLYDIEASQVAKALDNIAGEKLPSLAKLNLLGGQSAQEVARNIHPASTLVEAVRDAIHVQTCVPESHKIKEALFRKLDDACAQTRNTTVVLSSSASNLAPSSFTSSLQHRSQCLVSHPINPPFAIPCVEIVKAPYTDDSAVKRTVALMKKIGQAPLVLHKEVDGFIVNRLQYALLGECFRLVEDGVCEPEDIDTAVRDGLGLRWSFMGPFQTIDLNAPGGVQDYSDRYDKSLFRVLSSMDNKRQWNKNTVRKIDRAMRKQVPRADLKKRVKWRNQQLMQLHIHKEKQGLLSKL